MKYTTKRVVVALLAIVLLSAGVFSGVRAQTPALSDEQRARIRTNCVTAKNTLNQLHASDGLLRVNRGQIYDSMSTKLMVRFNSRADANRYDVKDLTSVTQTYNTTLTAFRADYQSYEEKLSEALKIDCVSEPSQFYYAVADARTKRTQVHTDVVKLHQYIDDYRAAFETFQQAFDGGTN